MHVKLFLGLLCAGLAVIFILQNAAVVEVKFLFWTLALSGALLMFILLSLGVIIGWLLNSVNRIRRDRTKAERKP